MKTYYEYHIASNTLLRLGNFESINLACLASTQEKPTLIFDHDELLDLQMQINTLFEAVQPHHIKATDEVVRQFYIDVMTTAVEGGINYWAVTKSNRNLDDDVLSFQAKDAENEEALWLYCNADSVRDAINAIIFEKVDVGIYCREAITEAFTTLDAGEIDAELADVIVQVALFNEVVYG